MSRLGYYDEHDGFVPYDDVPQENPRPTNADKIREMTDEELSKFLSWVAREGCNGAVSSRGVWSKHELVGGEIIPWINWLNEEISE